MRKQVTFYINDEPLVATATEQRQATITYEGPRYLYVEYCSEEQTVTAPVHMSDEPEMEAAEERRTQLDCRSIIEIDAQNDGIFTHCVYMPTMYRLSIPDYTETLPNGDEYTYEYPDDPSLDDIYDLKNMTFDPETKDFIWIYDVNDITEEEFIESIDDALSSINDDIDEGIFDADDMVKVNEYKAALTEFKESYDGSIKHWKLEFPVLELNPPV